MPLYSYSCKHCGDVTEMFRTMDHRHDPANCVKCEGKLVLVFQAPRALRTDTTFQAGFRGSDGCRDDATRRKLHENAQRLGVNIQGKKYDGRLARYWGDPRACYGSVSEARRAVALTGQGCEELGVKAPEEIPQPYRVADDIVDRHVDEIVRDEPIPTAKRAALREEVREKLSPSDGVCA